MEILFFLLLSGCYLIGSVNFAIIVCKLYHLPSPITVGSNNPGATNVLRIGGKLPAFLTLAGDFSKGALAVFLLLIFDYSPSQALIGGGVCFLGHIFPIFYGFKNGGKGVATYFGVLWGISPASGLVITATWLGCTWLFKKSALSALISIPLAPIIYYLSQNDLISSLFLFAMSILLIYRHKTNIRKMLGGSKPKN